MQKRTKIILASTVAVVFMAGAIGAGVAKDRIKNGAYGGPSFMKEARFGGHGKRGGAGMQEKIIEKFDIDKDGTITKAEIDGVRQSEISKYDADKDKKLNLNEFQTLWTGLMRERMVDHFQRLDSDGDAQVTEAEIAKPMERMMSFMDRNDDGQLTKDELKRRGWGHGKRGSKRGGEGRGQKHGEHRGEYQDDDDDDK